MDFGFYIDIVQCCFSFPFLYGINSLVKNFYVPYSIFFLEGLAHPYGDKLYSCFILTEYYGAAILQLAHSICRLVVIQSVTYSTFSFKTPHPLVVFIACRQLQFGTLFYIFRAHSPGKKGHATFSSVYFVSKILGLKGSGTPQK
jgi:hypothetical protein